MPGERARADGQEGRGAKRGPSTALPWNDSYRGLSDTTSATHGGTGAIGWFHGIAALDHHNSGGQ